MRWLLPSDPGDRAVSLATALDIAPPAARVLIHRGYDSADSASAFLHPSLDQLLPPAQLKSLPQAAERLHAAIRQAEPILLYGDYDVDGTMAVVILTKAIEVCGGKSSYHVPHRLKEGYGMRPEVVEEAAAQGVKLIVSVDTGIRAGEVVQHATALGIDVIVTDHHLPEAELPPALAVVNPNRPDCDYPNKDLCGAGVAFKLAQALMELQGWSSDKLRRMLDSFLKLAALATVADVVPLIGENRAIVKLGLDSFTDVKNVGLRELLRVAAIEPGHIPTVRQVGFQIGPRINAAGRMDSARKVVELFLTSDAHRAAAIAADLDSLNRDRRETEKRILDEIFESVTEVTPGMVLAGDGWHRGVVGIVASRVVERFYRPSFVLEIDREQGIAAGSGRSIGPFHLLEALETMPEIFEKFGGHSHAAGVTMPLERLDEFRSRFNDYAAGKLTADDLERRVRIDAVARIAELDEHAAKDLLALAPFGMGNPLPVIAVCGATIESVAPLGPSGRHFKLRLAQDGARLYVKAWSFDDRVSEFPAGSRVDAALAIEEDNYWGWAATLRDVRWAA